MALVRLDTENKVVRLEELLRQLAFHHDSQAKSTTPKSSSEYNKQLASRIREFLTR